MIDEYRQIIDEATYFEQFVGDEPDDILFREIRTDIQYRNRWLPINERWSSQKNIWIVQVVGYNAFGADTDKNMARMKALESWDDLMAVNIIRSISKE